MKIFDGRQFAAQKEIELSKSVRELKKQGKKIKIAAILFAEDLGSQLYSENKKLAAERVGIEYELHQFPISIPVENVGRLINELNSDKSVTGIIIQKPTFAVWQKNNLIPENPNLNSENSKQVFSQWWRQLYSQVDPKKDVDGLHPDTAEAIADGTWIEKGRVLPATVEAVRAVFNLPEISERIKQPEHKFIIIGKSDLIGMPLYHLLKKEGRAVELLGSQEFQARIVSGQALLDADTIITATGRRYLVTGTMIKAGVNLIDVGEPRPDVDWQGIVQKAAFVTPVPGGIGPVTVVSLLQNAVNLANMV